MPSSPAISPKNKDSSASSSPRFFSDEIDLSNQMSPARGRTQSAFQRHSAFCMKRAEFNSSENASLLRDLAFWLSAAGEKYVSERSFNNDLCDGVALCNILTKIQGSGVSSFHKVAPYGSAKASDNFWTFRRGCDRLSLPISFGLEDLRVTDNPDVMCTLIFLAHICHTQGVTTEAMKDHLLARIDEINDAIDESFSPMEIESSAQTIEESLSDMYRSMSASAKSMQNLLEEEEEKPDPWFASVAKYLATVKEWKEALKRSRQENVNAILEKTWSFKNSLPTSVRSRMESISGGLLARADSLPDVIKSRLPFEPTKRLT